MKIRIIRSMKKRLCLLLAIAITFMNKGVVIKAETDTDEIYMGEYTCDIQDGNILKVFDDEVCIVECTYENGYRTTKKGTNQSTFVYEEGYLTSEIRDNVQIQYFMEYVEEDGVTKYSGFVVNEIRYEYLWDEEGKIVGIVNESGNVLAKYVYDGLEVSNILEFKNSEWCESVDPNFIGNYNKIRGMGAYVDEETGWHYSHGLYDDVKNGRIVGLKMNDEFLTNINPFKYAEDGVELLGSVDDDEIATAWAAELLNNSSFNSARDAGWYQDTKTYTDVGVLARTIYGENTFRRDDQSALAWIILNRYYAGFGTTLREIVTKPSQFVGVDNEQARAAKSSTDAGWEYATYLACLLCTTTSETSWKAIVSKPSGISNQLYFRPASQLSDENYFENSSNGLVFKYSTNNIVLIYNACIAGKGTATDTKTLINYCGNSTYGYHVYFYHY